MNFVGDFPVDFLRVGGEKRHFWGTGHFIFMAKSIQSDIVDNLGR